MTQLLTKTFCIVLMTLTATTLMADLSNTYKPCTGGEEICVGEGEPDKPDQLLLRRSTEDVFLAWFYPDGRRTFSKFQKNVHKDYVSISRNGMVLINPKANTSWDTTKNYNSVYPYVRNVFISLPITDRKKIQTNLQKLQLYSAKIDGVWGQNTYKSILAYNTIFLKKIGILSEKQAHFTIVKIAVHDRFNYQDGRLEKLEPKMCSYDPENCTASQLCLFAAKQIGNAVIWQNDPKWRKHVSIAKERGLQCGVNSFDQCKWNAAACDDIEICNYAVSPGLGQKRWETKRDWLPHVKEAKRRGMSCGVIDGSSIPSNENSKYSISKTCLQNPATCSVQELCMRASVTLSGFTRWRTDAVSAPFVETAKKFGLGCGVSRTAPVEELYKVANGTGFIINERGYIVTNDHVIDGCNQIEVAGFNPARAKFIARDPNNDLAVIKVDGEDYKFLLLSKEEPYLNQEIIAAGYPFGDAISSSIKITGGRVSSLSGIGDNTANIQIDAALQPGNSGGPLLNNFGNVVGVSVAKLDTEASLEQFGVLPENVNFGIKLSTLKSFLTANEIEFFEGNARQLTDRALGQRADEGTVHLSCLMTETQIKKLSDQKAMYPDPN